MVKIASLSVNLSIRVGEEMDKVVSFLLINKFLIVVLIASPVGILYCSHPS